MGEAWFYAEGSERKGPVDAATIKALVERGALAPEAQVWKEGLATPMPAGAIARLVQPSAGQRARGLLATMGSKLSEVAAVPEIGDVPVGQVLGTGGPVTDEDIEEAFAVGTARTTPSLAEVQSGWPRPRVWWRILLGALAACGLLKLVAGEFDNPLAVPGTVVVGAFVVPMAVVVFFFEMNVLRNVSWFQVSKMTLLGGALSLVVVMFLFLAIPGSGTGDLLPALLTGVLEEAAKALALVIVLRSPRWRWQLNGLLFGAAVGAGFAGFESAGYAMRYENMNSVLFWRSLLAPGGHVIWTAMVGAALWQVRGARDFQWDMLWHGSVLRRWSVAVVLHGLWDTNLLGNDWWLLKCVILIAIGWVLVFGILKQGLAEVAEAKAAAPPMPATATPAPA
jgi:RsiW-degrading membrane proteinase PrsW (M82 family)